jgi:ABC-2 type transport system ATP-binding protein
MEASAKNGTPLVATGLTKRFGSRTAVSTVSLTVRPGERVAVIGPNGAGKTTLLSILAGIQRPDAGTVETAAARVGWVPQGHAIYGRLTVEENLRLFARLERHPDVDGVVARMLEQTALGDRAGDQVAVLSGGNRQRINVAVGLLSDPQVLLLDEPSAALDPRQRERLWEFVLGLAEGGTAVVYATHNIQEADRHAHQVVVLADGELVFQGSPQEMEAAVGATDLDFEEAFVAFLKAKGH